MLRHNVKKNKREIFYQSVNVFKKQDCVNKLILRFTKMFNVRQEDLLITTSLKGLFNGNLSFKINNKYLHIQNYYLCKENTKQQSTCIKYESCLIPDMSSVESVATNATTVLVIEKDSLFSFICTLCRQNKMFNNVLFVCGKGYPCYNTVKLLSMLNNCKIYGIFDYDPFGMHIYCVYKYGTKTNTTKITNMQRIGMCASDLFEYKIDENELIDMNMYDKRLLFKMYNAYPELHEDILFLQGLQKKMEMEIFTSKSYDFIISYLVKKLNLKE
ncbi:endodeoxyribonuclease [Binucleata daphniae]